MTYAQVRNAARAAAMASFAVLQAAQAVSPATEWAYEEFTNYTAKIFGAVPKVCFVLPDAAAWGTPPCRLEDFADDFAALKGTDGYAVRRRGDTLFFIADCAKGHVNGVHRWLEKNSDIIWPRPAGDLCFYTTTNYPLSSILYHLSSSSCDYRDIPAFKLRYFGGGTRDEATLRYLARNASSSIASHAEMPPSLMPKAQRYGSIGSYCDLYGGGHDMETRWFPRKEFFKDHPEYWMLVDGVRWTGADSNFCETNPGFAEAFARSVEEKIRNIPPSVKILSINMEDSPITCQCENCLKPIPLPDGTLLAADDPAFKSTRFFIFFNKVARHIAGIRPDLKIMQFDYLHLSVPPKVKLEPNVIVKFCPVERNMRQSVVSGKDAKNAEYRRRLDEWLSKTSELYWREYYFCGCVYYPRPVADTAVEDLRYLLHRGVKYVYTDSPGRFGDNERNNTQYSLNRPFREFYDMNAMEAWVVQKLFWDPSLDPEVLRAEFLRRTFGPAAPDMAAYWKILRAAWYAETRPSTIYDKPIQSTARFILEKGHADECRKALAAAECRADTPERRAWIATMRRVFDEWIDGAWNFVSLDIPVPVLDAEEAFPCFDFGGEPWRRAVKLPMLKYFRTERVMDKSGSRVRMFCDGSNLYAGFDVRKSCSPRTDGQSGVWPEGDKVELAFALKDGGFLQFAVGCDGRKFEAHGLDASWTCDWDARVEHAADGWRAVVRIPLSAIGKAFPADRRARMNAAIYFADGGKARSCMFSFHGGIPYKPSSWGWISIRHGIAE